MFLAGTVVGSVKIASKWIDPKISSPFGPSKAPLPAIALAKASRFQGRSGKSAAPSYSPLTTVMSYAVTGIFRTV